MSFGGKFDYDKAYSKYKPGVEDTQFEAYVDATPDLKDAWAKIQAEPAGEQGSYWTPRGATSKAAFGRAHAAEDAALRSGKYHGGTDVMPDTSAYTDYFGAGDTPDTRFEDWVSGAAAAANGGGNGWATARGGGAPGSANYPMGLVDYQEPSAMSGIPLDFQPWLQPDHIPDSLWNYQAPTLNEWEVERNWDWATKPASEYLTDEQKAAAAAAQIRGDRDIESGVRFSDPYGYRIGGPGADDQLWDYLAQEDEGTTTPFTMDDLNAMSGMPSAQALAQALANENTDDFSAASQVTGAQPYP